LVDDDDDDILARFSRLVGDDQRLAIDRISEIEQNADDASRTATRLSFSVYAMLGWISVVTVAIAAVAVATVRWRRRPNVAVDFDDVVERDRTRSLTDVDEMSCSSSQIITVNE